MKRINFLLLVIIEFFFKEAQGQETMTDDRDGKVYKTVTIAGKIWMAQNLAYAKEEIGEPSKDNYILCYDDSIENCNKYGMLYSWKAARAACPNGWHLPTKADVDSLLGEINSDESKKKAFNITYAGWAHFSYLNRYVFKDKIGTLLTSIEGKNPPYRMVFHKSSNKIRVLDGYEMNGWSVRCVKE